MDLDSKGKDATKVSCEEIIANYYKYRLNCIHIAFSDLNYHHCLVVKEVVFSNCLNLLSDHFLT